MTPYREALRDYAEATGTGGQPLPAPRVARARVAAAVVPLLAAAAAALLLLNPTPPAPEPVARGFADQGEAALGDAVHVRWEGSGHVSGDTRTLALGWDAGTVEVEVTPDAGVALTVFTPEARVRVVGTGFDVRRDAFGTGVSVRHGLVGVTCQGGVEASLAAGASMECLPTSAAALLGRARAQMRRGDSPTAVLATVTRAPRGTDPEADAELTLVEATELARDGRTAEALAVADAAWPTATHRRVELLRLATRLGVDLGGCPRARPYAEALAALGEPTPCP